MTPERRASAGVASAMDSVPVVFVHQGRCGHLQLAVRQALSCAGRAGVWLLGDAQSLPGVHCEPLVDYGRTAIALEFQDHYTHLSTNRHEFELICWLRWFYLLEFMERHEIEACLYLDSDVLLYQAADVVARFCMQAGKGCAFFIPSQDEALPRGRSASAHVSYWTRTSLEAWCRFASGCFVDPLRQAQAKAKWEWHKATATPGGVCDMTGLFWFWEEEQGNIANLALPEEGGAIDVAMGSQDNFSVNQYRLLRGIKEVIKSPAGYSLVRVTDGGLDPVWALHFQGWTKEYMSDYYTGKRFIGLYRGRLTVAWHRMMRRAIWRVSS